MRRNHRTAFSTTRALGPTPAGNVAAGQASARFRGGRGWRMMSAPALALGAFLATAVSGPGVAAELYLRAGIGMDAPLDSVFTDVDCATKSHAPLYGCGKGGDGAPLRSTGGFERMPVLELGLGYAVSPALRLEAFVEQRRAFEFEGLANYRAPGKRQDVSAELSSVSGMLAAFFDFPEFELEITGPVRPFLGAGAGIVRNRIGETRMIFTKTMTVVPGTRRSDLAWMLTAGLGLAVAEGLTLDIAWRYTDRGEAETGAGAGRVVWLDGSRTNPINQGPTRARLRDHGIRVSIRHAF